MSLEGWTLSQLEITELPADADGDITFTVTPYSQDANSATPTEWTALAESLVVVIDAVADTPSLTLGGVADNNTASGNEGTAIALPDIAANLNDTDASETLKIEISGLPAGWTLSDGTNSSTTATTDVTGWNLNTLTVTGPAEDDQDFTLTVTATATEGALVDGDHPLSGVASGGRSTLILPQQSREGARRQWIGGRLKPLGEIIIDDGAAKALAGGSSLLPAGVVRVAGDFQRGDPVTIRSIDGEAIGQGLSAFGALEIVAIAGKKSDEVEAILGYRRRPAVVEKNDLVLKAARDECSNRVDHDADRRGGAPGCNGAA